MDLDPRLTEAANPATATIDQASAARIVGLINAEDRLVPQAVAREAESVARLIDEVERRIRAGGRLVYVGAGTSGRLGVLDAAECPPTFGTEPETVRGVIAGGAAALERSREGAEDDEGAGRSSMQDLEIGPSDFVLGIAASGTTPFVHAALAEARRRGAAIGALCFTPPPGELLELADIAIMPIVGPEVIAGSTRMKAGTATKLILNTLTTGVMIRLGKVYRNLMVDLQASSRKLAGRSLRIVREVCELEADAARRLLVAAGGSSKTAIAMHELRASRAVAERALDECDGFLGAAIERFADKTPPYYAGYPCTFGPEDLALLRHRLRSAPARIRRAVEQAPPRRTSGGWGPREHIAHLIECEVIAFRPRVERLLEADAPHFDDWEPSREPPGEGGAETLLDRFEAERSSTCRRIESITAEEWSRPGTIGEEGITLYQLLRGVAHHDEAHATRIRERVYPDLIRAADGPSVPPAADRS